MRIDPQQVIAQINAMLAEFPELADDETLRADTFEGATDLHDILTMLVEQTLDAVVMIRAIKARKMDLADRQSRYERAEDARRALIVKLMQIAELRKVVLTEATLSLKTMPPSPMITDEDELPDEFVQLIRKPDLNAIKADIAIGHVPPGVTIKNGYETVQIRTK